MNDGIYLNKKDKKNVEPYHFWKTIIPDSYPYIIASIVYLGSVIVSMFLQDTQESFVIGFLFIIAFFLPFILYWIYRNNQKRKLNINNDDRKKIDERTKKISYIAMSYSWRYTFFSAFLIGLVGTFINNINQNITVFHFFVLLILIQLTSLIISHWYFSRKGDI